MDFDFDDPDLEEIYYEAAAITNLGPAVDKGFRKVMGWIKDAKNELDLRTYKSLHYHQLEGDRSHQHGMNITDKYRLITERIEEDGKTKLLIVEITDYH